MVFILTELSGFVLNVVTTFSKFRKRQDLLRMSVSVVPSRHVLVNHVLGTIRHVRYLFISVVQCRIACAELRGLPVVYRDLTHGETNLRNTRHRLLNLTKIVVFVFLQISLRASIL